MRHLPFKFLLYLVELEVSVLVAAHEGELLLQSGEDLALNHIVGGIEFACV